MYWVLRDEKSSALKEGHFGHVKKNVAPKVGDPQSLADHGPEKTGNLCVPLGTPQYILVHPGELCLHIPNNRLPGLHMALESHKTPLFKKAPKGRFYPAYSLIAETPPSVQGRLTLGCASRRGSISNSAIGGSLSVSGTRIRKWRLRGHFLSPTAGAEERASGDGGGRRELAS